LHAGIGALRSGGDFLLLQREQRALRIERHEQIHLTGLVLPSRERDSLSRRSGSFFYDAMLLGIATHGSERIFDLG
jgi:hypothetical protein